MAKILYGGGVANMSGSQAGTVHSHNQFGSYTRNRVVPVNPQTSKQTLARNALSYIASLWRSLTDPQRLEWASLGAQIVRTDALGQSYTLKGFSAYCLVNLHRRNNGLAALTTAPSLDSAPQVTNVLVTAEDTPVLTVGYSVTGGLATNSLEIWASGPVSAGKSYIQPTQLKKIARILGNAVSPYNAYGAYELLFGALGAENVGEKIFFEIRPYSANDIPGAVVRGSTTVAAG